MQFISIDIRPAIIVNGQKMAFLKEFYEVLLLRYETVFYFYCFLLACDKPPYLFDRGQWFLQKCVFTIKTKAMIKHKG